ncbi:hypothetical protein Sulac_1721 [Sulfobacillus acidophilus DSM 10332]|uniref:Uncharacterized protein n=1 Tax=Sulfobacillus acidophilus (strain ATCC 700253 / DSM 10332 / NAL) TaxID=679936 RepID=G8TZH7_SULAD|nr:hypothetical protein Sulac_1721 [Sulfobacillus acidophilus DSM 10332]
MASKRFVRLERAVEREYRKKGYGLKRARKIGRAVAGKVAQMRRKAARAAKRGARKVWQRHLF